MEVQKKVLLIGENSGLCKSLQRELAPAGYEMAIIEDLGESLRRVIEAGDYAMGFELSLRVRKWVSAPILVLRTSSMDGKVRMMDLKSETLCTEPFSTEELALIFWTTLFSSQPPTTCWS